MKNINIAKNIIRDNKEAIQTIKSWMEEGEILSIVLTEKNVLYVSSRKENNIPLYIPLEDDLDTDLDFLFTMLYYCKTGSMESTYQSYSTCTWDYYCEIASFIHDLGYVFVRVKPNCYAAFMPYGRLFLNMYDSEYKSIQSTNLAA